MMLGKFDSIRYDKADGSGTRTSIVVETIGIFLSDERTSMPGPPRGSVAATADFILWLHFKENLRFLQKPG